MLEESNWKGRGAYEMVDKTSLDELMPMLSNCPSFVKIDVEGMEMEVLKGGRELIRRCRPVLHIENNCKKDSKEVRACEERNTGVGERIEATNRCEYPANSLRSSLTPF